MVLISKLWRYVFKKEGLRDNITNIWHNYILLKFNDLTIKFFSNFNQIQQQIFKVLQSNAIIAFKDYL